MAAIWTLGFATDVDAHSKIQVGVYYYPGWADNKPGNAVHPWEVVKPYRDRKPLLGWYPEGDPSIMAHQLAWMRKYDISYVVFDWYWNRTDPRLDQAILAYQAVNQSSVKYSILWANHSKDPFDKNVWRDLVSYWIAHYFSDSRYQLIDGKPVVFIFSATKLQADAIAAGVTVQSLFDDAQSMAKAAGLKGVYFVADTFGGTQMANKDAPSDGYSALSTYNYHAPAGDSGFESLSSTYSEQWSKLAESPLPVIVPMTSGWDRSPWGGSDTDGSIADEGQFGAHLSAGATFANQHGYKYGIICCWNEFGEGSFIEPTMAHGFGIISQVRKVFSK